MDHVVHYPIDHVVYYPINHVVYYSIAHVVYYSIDHVLPPPASLKLTRLTSGLCLYSNTMTTDLKTAPVEKEKLVLLIL